MPISIYKNKGETPLQALDRFRLEKPEYRGATLSYAGRLDPMAEGEILVLVGDENKERDKYLNMDKEYEVEILFGFATDTYDILGLITEHQLEIANDEFKKRIEEELEKSVGTFLQPYPKYSSKSISNNFEEKDLNPKEVTIYSIEIMYWREINASDLLKQVISDINLVKGDFRQEAIKQKWHEALALNAKAYSLLTIKVKCSSGTYMRSLAHMLGRRIGIPALASQIKRTMVY